MLLYELLTGELPFSRRELQAAGYAGMQQVIREKEPPKPSTKVTTLGERAAAAAQHRALSGRDFAKAMRGDLDWITLKALEKNRTRRYATTQELAADLERYLRLEPVLATPPSFGYRAAKFVRKYRAQCAAAAAVGLALVFGGVGVWWQMQVAQQERDAATAAKQNAERSAAEAAAAQRSADAKAKELASKVAEFDQLALVVDYERLMKEAPELGTAYPEQLPAITDWLQRAQRLLGRQAELAAVVAAVRQAAGTVGAPRTDAPDAARDVAPTGGEQAAQFLAQSLGDLLGKLPQLAALVAPMQQRQRWATAVEALTLAHPNARVTWAAARAAVAASPKYALQDIPLRDRDVLGMVPIGANPQSGLWEFYDLRSAWDGASDPAALPIPAHGADGRVAMTGASGIVWVLLPGGTLPAGTVDEGNEDKPSVRLAVRLDPFFLAKHELTQGQWQRWTGANPSDSKDRNDLSLPVETVNWYQCHDTLAQVGLVLPSELQREYAIRAGTTTKWWTGDDEKALLAAENIGAGTKLLPVGSKQPNPFGLFDMGGNVWEWCYDELGGYGSERAGDGRRPDPASGPLLRCFRGGGFTAAPVSARSGSRVSIGAPYRDVYLGARPARTSRR